MSQIPIFIINLEESKERWKRISSELDTLGLNYERFPGIKASELSEEEIKENCPVRYMWWYRSDMPLGAIGCYMSHIAVLKLMIDRGLEKICILEDDAVFEPECVEWLQDNTPIPSDGDILKLSINGDTNLLSGIPVQTYQDRDIVFLPRRGIHGAYAYIVTQKAAQQIIKDYSIITDAYDQAIFEYWNSKLSIYHAFPPVIKHAYSDSIIDRDRLPKGSHKAKKSFSYRLRRRMRDIRNFYKQQVYMAGLLGVAYPFRIKKLTS